ncbi:MAG TPA: hypothetical protein VFW80_04160 [Gaiellaceae bacterium]|nr:hypothetical protein [Gaiellaceae bacterium]
MDEPVEGREQRGAALEVVHERGGIDAPLALYTLDDGWLAGLADVDRLHRHGPRPLCRAMPSDASRRSSVVRVASSTEGTARLDG